MLTVLTFAQEINTFDFAVINTTVLSANIDLENGRSVVVANKDQYSAYFQYAFDMCDEDIIFGAGIDKTEIDRAYPIWVTSEKFVASLKRQLVLVI